MPDLPRSCSLIISTYNWPEALELTLKSIMRQDRMPDEVIIADDGSTDHTQSLINHYKNSFPTNLIHVWHEDQGFRLASIRNKAFAASTKDYIIQIDGDIILHPKFVTDHLAFAKQNCLLQGSRVMLGKNRSKILLKQKETHISFFDADIKRRENGIRCLALSNYLLTRYKNRYPIYYARGANMSFWKEDILKVNGYNESFEGWGHEDSDLTLRLLNNGVKKYILKFSAIAYHLFHPENKSAERELTNKKLLEETYQNKVIWTQNGLSKYLTNHEYK